MKKAILVLFVLGFVGMNGYAQKVYKGTDGKVYLECTVASGMPAGSVTTIPKCVGGTAYADKYRNDSNTTNLYAWENDKVFEKLEIDKSNLYIITVNWVNAYNCCKDKNKGGVTGWRLPTQRELMLMYIFRDQLSLMTGNNFDSDFYWSSSEEDNSRNSGYVTFNNGRTDSIEKETECYVRCVREVK